MKPELLHAKPRQHNPFRLQFGEDWGCRVSDMLRTALVHGDIFREETGKWPNTTSGPIRTLQGTPTWRSLDTAITQQSFWAHRLWDAFRCSRAQQPGVCTESGRRYNVGATVYTRPWVAGSDELGDWPYREHGLHNLAVYTGKPSTRGPPPAELVEQTRQTLEELGLTAYSDHTAVVYVGRPQSKGCSLMALWWPTTGRTLSLHTGYSAGGPLCADVRELAAWLLSFKTGWPRL